jgi:hypothetical protein
MNEKRKRRGVAFWTILVVVLLGLLYPLSYGPSVQLLRRGRLPNSTHRILCADDLAAEARARASRRGCSLVRHSLAVILTSPTRTVCRDQISARPPAAV